MSPARTSSRERARRREVRREIARLQEMARVALEEFDRLHPPAPDAGVVIEGRVEDGKVILDATAGPAGRR
jgi:cytochrome P450